MAVVSSIPMMGESIGSMRFHGIDSPGSRSSRTEIMEEPVSRLIEEKVYVALGKDVAKNKTTLVWALQNTGGKKICIIHVHQPAHMIPVMGTKFLASSVDEEGVRVYRKMEREKVHMILDEYLRICQQRGVRAEKMYIEMDSVEKGIVRLISQHRIRKFVMGAASDRYHSRKMRDLRSRKAMFVQREAPATCHIWFTCKGSLICTRRPSSDRSSDTDKGDRAFRAGPSGSDAHLRQFGRSESAPGLILVEENSDHSSPRSFPNENLDDAFYDQIRQAMAEAHNSKQEIFREVSRRHKAEEIALDAIRKAKQSENVYSEELKRRKETEIALAKEKEELEKLKREREEIMEELRSALEQRTVLENRIAESDRTSEELLQKIVSAVGLLQSFRKERDELQTERDRALREAEELRKIHIQTPDLRLSQFFTDFSFSEIENATNHFDPTLKIGEGGYGSIYIGILRHTQVAIKLLNPNSSQGPIEYQQEVDVLSKMRHPNIITLIGACPEALSLVYEFLPNGSLEDRLNCKDNSPPLSWQTRLRIATEICAALIFLHSNKSHGIIHGDLKPANILLDANLVSKICDFGTCSLLRGNGRTSSSTDFKGTYAYLDPETSSSEELTPRSDVYSFGIILLRLLTGRPALRITNEVKYALESGTLNNLLDPLAGDWPFFQAEQLARLALRCCETVGENRPNLKTEVWRILEPMRASIGLSSFHFGPNHHHRRIAPLYFICPVFLEVMQDPHVAADGFTYEAEAIRAWLDSGHDTSPMTNVKLSHTSLIPNHALRSAVQEWLQHHR
ncbi:PREDICTED: U-box domain-containing protein 33-like isoform X3 [Tarenaya hassleriana]|uniref:U-box domain-containing protein 33-like isoform X3 n=1 Tax=Tarenaya hassleriana TaxID=28532 RepID=UPI00053C1D58|nr:PREDICTED: U-box domain-containing protein 33-like isoform X3 [Tarenaya hassleriana]